MNKADMNGLLEKRFEVERDEKWREMQIDIPFIQFDSNWKIKIIPPFAGAMARFIVSDQFNNTCSVYLDTYNRLGCFNGPYWEVYPIDDNDTERFTMDDVSGLGESIRKSLNGQNK